MANVGTPTHNGYNFVSRFDIGDPVLFLGHIKGNVRTITFTSGKVRYSIFLLIEETTLHNIDSCFIEERVGEKITFDFDNYS
jgi:hypothetical protein